MLLKKLLKTILERLIKPLKISKFLLKLSPFYKRAILVLYKRAYWLYNLYMKLILASNSPRRKEILKNNGFIFDVIPSNIEETPPKNASPEEYVKYLAKLKATDVYLKHKNVVLGADTIVVLNNKILGKPKDKFDAYQTLKNLSNNTHAVYTGYCIISQNKKIVGLEKTYVTFNNLSDELINDYISKELCFDKAGSYGIQDGFPFVAKIEGDYDNVVGLPINKIKRILKELL